MYRRFIPVAAFIQAPLNTLLMGPTIKGSQPVVITEELTEAFEKLKNTVYQRPYF